LSTTSDSVAVSLRETKPHLAETVAASLRETKPHLAERDGYYGERYGHWMSAALWLALVVLPGLARAEIYVAFEDVQPALGPESFFNGAQRYYSTNPPLPENENGRFTSGDLAFNNHFHADPQSGSKYWDGWACSNVTDNTTAGFQNQYSAITGAGFQGSANYAVAYHGYYLGNAPAITNVPGDGLLGAYLTNTTYAYGAMAKGNSFAKKFGGSSGNDPDWFLLEIDGTKADGSPAGTVEFYLADFRFGDNAQDYIISDWTWVDLTGLDEPGSLEFHVSSSDNDPLWGMNTPAYFAMDQIVLEGAAEKLLTWDGLGDGPWHSDTHWLGGNPGAIPDLDSHVAVLVNTVTAGADGSALSLAIEQDGGLAVGIDKTLTLATHAEIVDGQLRISPGGLLEVGGDLQMGDAAEFVCEMGSSSGGRIAVEGDAHLDGTLRLPVVSIGEQRGDVTRTIITSAGDGGILGEFAEAPPVHDPNGGPEGHLGLGVFHRGVNYVDRIAADDPATAVSVDLFIARGGDSNADGYVDGRDIMTLIVNYNGNQWKPVADRTWDRGDTVGGLFDRGDGLVDGRDIIDLIANFGRSDPGASPEATAAAEYDPVTGEFSVSVENVMFWTLQSNGEFTGSGLAGLEEVLASEEGTLISANPNTVGNGTFTGLLSYRDVELGRLAAPGTDPGRFTLEYVTGFGGEKMRGTITVVPEPGTLVMLVLALLALNYIGKRRRGRLTPPEEATCRNCAALVPAYHTHLVRRRWVGRNQRSAVPAVGQKRPQEVTRAPWR